jgi:SAM-dependent methyltransferase
MGAKRAETPTAQPAADRRSAFRPISVMAPTQPPSFAPLAMALRDHVIEHYERAGLRLDTPAGRRTLDTNSSLAAARGRVLLRLLAEAGGGPIRGRRVLDLGAGFGALSVYFGHLGAEVVAVDPNEERLGIGVAVARRYGLALSSMAAHAEALPLPDATFHLVVANNSLCYIVDRDTRRAAMAELLRVLAPGGWLVMRNPNRLAPLDPFTQLPLLALLPPSFGRELTHRLGRHRSEVRLMTPQGAVRELRRAGFAQTSWRAAPGRRVGAMVASYHHVVARRPCA